MFPTALYLRTPALPFMFTLFYLATGHSTTPLPLRPCARRRTFGNNTFLTSSPCGSVTSEIKFHSFFSLFPFCSHTLVAHLFYRIGLSSHKYSLPGFAKTRHPWPAFPILLVCVPPRATVAQSLAFSLSPHAFRLSVSIRAFLLLSSPSHLRRTLRSFKHTC